MFCRCAGRTGLPLPSSMSALQRAAIAYGPRRMSEALLYGAVEAGGTKFVCEVAEAGGTIRAQTRIPTTTPAETLARVLDFFAEHAAPQQYAAFGIAAF